jgi:hypothetical protein
LNRLIGVDEYFTQEHRREALGAVCWFRTQQLAGVVQLLKGITECVGGSVVIELPKMRLDF